MENLIQEIIAEKTIVLYGAGDTTRRILSTIPIEYLNNITIVDDNIHKLGSIICGVIVNDVEKIKIINSDFILITIEDPAKATFTYYQLKGFVKSKVILVTGDIEWTRAHKIQSDEVILRDIQKIFPQVNAGEVQSVVREFISLTQKSIGRVASHLFNYILLYFLRKYTTVKGNKGNAHIDIGVLYGFSSLISMKGIAASQGKHGDMYLIDPFDGFYNQEQDPFTGLKITKEHVEYNLKTWGFSNTDCELICGYSNDPRTLELIEQLEFTSVYIDGDHSYSGIKQDWENFSPKVSLGGYILIDNYLDEYWPGVTEYVDNELLIHTNNKWTVVSSSFEYKYLLLRKVN